MTHINTRRDTAANWTSVNPILQAGELGFESDTRKFKFGNGTTAWNSLLYALSGISATKSDVGLSQVDNTSDLNKPISTLTQTALNLKAPLVSPALTGTPTSPTPSTSDNSTKIATTAFVAAQAFAPLASPTLTGDPKAPTATSGDNDTSIATTAFVTDAVARSHPICVLATVANDTLSGLTARDGVTPTAGQLVLVGSQTSSQNNGIYVAASGTWARWAGAATAAQIAALGYVEVLAGTLNGGTVWITPFRSTDTLGTTAQPWYCPTKPTHFRGYNLGGTALTANTAIPFTAEVDSDQAWASNTYTVKRPGVYRVGCQMQAPSGGIASGENLYLLRNASVVRAFYSNGAATPAFGSLGGSSPEVAMVANDYFTVTSSIAFTPNSTTAPFYANWLTIDWVRDN